MAAISSNTIETWRDAFLSALAPIADFKLLQRAVP
jgi:hypothetical protein